MIEHETRCPLWRLKLIWLCAVSAIAVLGLYWVAYLPIRPHRPFCNVKSAHAPVELYGPHLNARYRAEFREYLDWTGTFYVEIGDVIYVPLIENGYEDQKGLFERLFEITFSTREFNWIYANGKVEGLMPFYYAQDHPNSEIARLYAKSQTNSSNRLKCDLIKAIADPDLK